MKEERDLYDFNLNLTDKTYFKGDKVEDGYYPMVVMIAIQNSKGEFLMQKRTEDKGGDWGVTGGHPKHGETPYQGIITEVKEELGIDIKGNEIIEFDRGCDNKDCYIMYYTKIDLDINDFKIQKEELTEVKWFKIDTLKEMVKNHELNQDQIEFFNTCVNYLESLEK